MGKLQKVQPQVMRIPGWRRRKEAEREVERVKGVKEGGRERGKESIEEIFKTIMTEDFFRLMPTSNLVPRKLTKHQTE